MEDASLFTEGKLYLGSTRSVRTASIRSSLPGNWMRCVFLYAVSGLKQNATQHKQHVNRFEDIWGGMPRRIRRNLICRTWVSLTWHPNRYDFLFGVDSMSFGAGSRVKSPERPAVQARGLDSGKGKRSAHMGSLSSKVHGLSEYISEVSDFYNGYDDDDICSEDEEYDGE